MYRSYIPDYPATLFNLCYPVMTNAIGLGLIGQDIHKLKISASQRADILHLMLPKTMDDIRKMVEQSTLSMCKCLGITAPDETSYWLQASAGFSVRLFEATKQKDLSKILI